MATVLLAAGLGRRMRPLTEAGHKSLIEISPGSTILGRILHSLRRRGIGEVVIVTGYRADDIRRYVERGFPDMRFVFVHNARFAETNNIHSMALALQAVDLSEGLLLIESDLVVDDAVFDALDASPHPNVALVDHYQPGMDGTVVRMDAGGRIISVIPPDQQSAGFDFSDTFKTLNIYRFSAAFAAGPFARMVDFYAKTVDDNCYYELVLGILIGLGHAAIGGALVPTDSWCEVDDPVDLVNARFLSSPATRRAALDEAWGGYWGLNVTDFAFLRNMHFPTPQIIAELRLQLPELLHCYGSSQDVLDRKMSWFLGVGARHVVAVNGASQFFPWAAQHFAHRDVWLPDPTFGEWTRAFPDAARYPDSDDGRLALPAALPEGAVVVVVNPNNPTGSTVSDTEILDRCRANPQTLFLVDESFIAFSDQRSVIGHLERTPLDNVVVLQSLSKTLGVPGLRLGFVYSTNAELAAGFRATLPIWNMNSVAEKFLEVLLKNRPELERSWARTADDRTDLIGRLERADWVRAVRPGGANFVLVELDMDRPASARLADGLMSEHRIYVKDVSAKFPGRRGVWRLAVRLPGEHAVLLDAVAGLLSRSGKPR